MTNTFKISDEEERRVNYLSTLFAGLPAEEDHDFESLSQFEQDFLASAKRQFDIWQDLSLGQEEILHETWLKFQERKLPT